MGSRPAIAAWRKEAGPILALGTIGTAATAGLLSVFAHYLLGFEWTLAALVAVALSPTDPAAVYATLRGRDQFQRARVVLEGESGFNDPVSISLMIAVVAFVSSDHATVTGSAVHLVQELGLGLVGGVVGAGVLILLLKATPRLEDALESIAVLITVVVIGAATAVVHGSGFLAVYVAGLLFADRWAAQDGTKHAIPGIGLRGRRTRALRPARSRLRPSADRRRCDRWSSPHARHVLLVAPGRSCSCA